MIRWNSVRTPNRIATAFPAGAAADIRSLGAGAARGSERGFVIREIGYFLHVLGMRDLIAFVENEDRPAFNSQFLDQSSVIRTERAILMVGKHLDLVDA